MHKAISRFAIQFSLLLLIATGAACQPQPTNIILLIGDGMGAQQVAAAGAFAGRPMAFEGFEHTGWMTTHSADSPVTDSDAAGTAMATGYKVDNGLICLAGQMNPDYRAGDELPTILERLQARGKATGLVTTTHMTHATPAAFAAHEPSRRNYDQIAADYLNQSRPDILLGGGGKGLTPAAARQAGYTVVTDRAGMQAIGDDGRTVPKLSGQFGSGHMPFEHDGPDGYKTLPHLSEMTATALKLLDNDPDGFFLMVEGGRIDHACHKNHIERCVTETIEFDAAARKVLEWAAGRDDTLILVTADHETGGLKILSSPDKGKMPRVSWSSKGHTAAAVPVYATGPRARRFAGKLDNTQLIDRIMAPRVQMTRQCTTCGP